MIWRFILWTMGMPLLIASALCLSSFFWVSGMISDNALDGKQSIICISNRDHVKYNMSNPPLKIIDFMLVRMLEFHNYKPDENLKKHSRSFIIYSTLRAFWSPEERRILYQKAVSTMRTCSS